MQFDAIYAINCYHNTSHSCCKAVVKQRCHCVVALPRYLGKEDGSVEPQKIHTVVISTQHAEPLKAKRSKDLDFMTILSQNHWKNCITSSKNRHFLSFRAQSVKLKMCCWWGVRGLQGCWDDCSKHGRHEQGFASAEMEYRLTIDVPFFSFIY